MVMNVLREDVQPVSVAVLVQEVGGVLFPALIVLLVMAKIVVALLMGEDLLALVMKVPHVGHAEQEE